MERHPFLYNISSGSSERTGEFRVCFRICGICGFIAENLLKTLPDTERPVTDDLISAAVSDMPGNISDGFLVFQIAARKDECSNFLQLSAGEQKVEISQNRLCGKGSQFLMPFRADRFDIQHYTVADSKKIGIPGKIQRTVGIYQGCQPEGFRFKEQFPEKFVIECTLSSGGGNAIDIRTASPDLSHDFFDRHKGDPGRGIVRTDPDAGVALNAGGRIPADLSMGK